jgi:hypothetical protein
MLRIGGTGFTHLGPTAQDGENRCAATVWLTLFFLPLFPIRRERLELGRYVGDDGYRFTVLERTKLAPGEIVKTLLFSWVLVPAAVLLPAWLGTPEGLAWLGAGKIAGIVIQVIYTAYLCVLLIGLSVWSNNRLHPRTKKE